MKKTFFLSFLIIIILSSCNSGKKYKQSLAETMIQVESAKIRCATYIDSYKNVWSTAIRDNEYKGKYCADYNEALADHYKILHLEDGSKTLAADMQKLKETVTQLNDYPSKYKEAYDSLVDIYTDLDELYGYADEPKGSLTTYANNTFDLYQKLTKKIKEFNIKTN